MKKITIYTQDSCGYCKTIKEEFTKNDMKFEERFISECKDEWNEIVRITNIAATPTIFFEENYFVPGRDFNTPQNLITTISNYKKGGELDLFAIAQKIKTLNYNMGMAFGRMDQLLRTIEQKVEVDNVKEIK